MRRAFHELSLYALEKPLEDVPKRPAGSRQTWFLENSDIIKLINGAQQPDILLFIVLGIQCGARPSSMTQISIDDVLWDKQYIHYYESKKKMYVPRFFIDETWVLLKEYVSDMALKPTQKIFPQNHEYYTDKLKEIGFAQGIPLLQAKGAGAYVLRHTFATQACEHDVSAEVVMKQGAWKETATLMAHYVFVKTSKMQRELLGKEVEKPLNFGQWIKQFAPLWLKRYQEIRPKV